MHLRRSLAALLAAGTLFTATACAGDDLDQEGTDDNSSSPASTESASGGATGSGPVRISGQNFPEAELVAAMYEQLLSNAGYTPEVNLVDSRDAYLPIFPDSVDVVPEYVGGIVNALNSRENGDNAEPFEAGDGDELAADGQQLLDGAGISLLDISEATDTNAFFVTEEYASENDVDELSDLEGVSLKLAAAPDCEGRLDCEGGLVDDYGIDVTEVVPLGYASAQTYKAVIDGEVELGETSTTDGTLESQGLVVLDDDQEIQPAQNLVPAVSTAFLDANPQIADILNPLMAALTTEKLTELNAQVSVERQQPADVATEFLTSEGLL